MSMPRVRKKRTVGLRARSFVAMSMDTVLRDVAAQIGRYRNETPWIEVL